MKKLLATALATAAVASAANAQGTVNFKNYFTGTASDPVIYFAGGTTGVAGAQYVVGLMGGADAASMTLITTTTFLAQGYYVGPSVAVPGVLGGAVGTFEIIAWDTTLNGTTTGASFASAEAYAASHPVANIWGASAIFTNPTGNPGATPPGLPADLVNATSFSLNPVPEPSTLALAGLAAASGLIFRRRK